MFIAGAKARRKNDHDAMYNSGFYRCFSSNRPLFIVPLREQNGDEDHRESDEHAEGHILMIDDYGEHDAEDGLQTEQHLLMR